MGKLGPRSTRESVARILLALSRADPGRKEKEPDCCTRELNQASTSHFNDGDAWVPFQMNLPIVPVTDLCVKDDDLIVATQGRSFWILDNLTVLHQLDESVIEKQFHLFQPKPLIKLRGWSVRRSPNPAGQGLPYGFTLFFHVAEDSKDVGSASLEFKTTDGLVIQRFSVKPKPDQNVQPIKVEPGLNTFTWNMRYPGAESFPGLIMWSGSTRGPVAPPGTYVASLQIGDRSESVEFEIKADPRTTATQEDYELQFQFLLEVRDKLSKRISPLKRYATFEIKSLVTRHASRS